jgi:hypothetical protein
MKISLTVDELFDLNLWDKYCSLTGTNEYAVKEGLMSSDEVVTLPAAMAKEMLKSSKSVRELEVSLDNDENYFQYLEWTSFTGQDVPYDPNVKY